MVVLRLDRLDEEIGGELAGTPREFVLVPDEVPVLGITTPCLTQNLVLGLQFPRPRNLSMF